MSSARRKSRMPPAIRKAGMPIPRASSSASPASAKRTRMTVPRTVPRIAASLALFGVALGKGYEDRGQPRRVHDHE
jgi:hypothetical protein